MTERRHIHSEYDDELNALHGLLLEMGGSSSGSWPTACGP